MVSFTEACALLMASVQTAAMAVCEEEEAERASRRGRKARKRNRATVSEIYENMGPNLFRRYYPMSYESFWILHDKLGDSIEICTMAVQGWTASSGGDESGFGGGSGRGGNHTDPPTPNGKISSDVRLGCALRYFAGGSPGDILSTYRISLTSVLLSVWGVVEAVNQCEEFHISYPPCHELQRRIAADFASVSDVNFTACAGAIDGVLICIGKPSEKDAKSSGISRKKLFCARKNKFGLNCQAVSDRCGRILDISINYGGASSDILAFEASDLYQRLNSGILADGLVLFGDNAYLNTPFMATPYPNAKPGAEDNYNFYHSQLRIRVECAFGMLVHRWAILRSEISFNVTIVKVVALVNALAKLHNFCIDVQERHGYDERVLDSLPLDTHFLRRRRGGLVSLDTEAVGNESPIPTQLLGAGHHSHDYPRDDMIRRINRSVTVLPRTTLMRHIVSTGMRRP